MERMGGHVPSRILREGILSSFRINSLSLEAEVFYRRLMSAVDDFGRYFAHPALLRPALYPLRVDSVSEKDCLRMMAECEGAKLLIVYEVNSSKYLQLLDFKQAIRATCSKYPECSSDATQLHSKDIAPSKTNAKHPSAVFVVEDVSEDEDAIAASAAMKRTRRRRPVWDAIAEVWFGGSVPEPDRSRVGKLEKQFKGHNATLAEIRKKIEGYRTKWPSVEATPEAIAKHWVMLGQEPKIDGWVPRYPTSEELAEMEGEAAK